MDTAFEVLVLHPDFAALNFDFQTVHVARRGLVGFFAVEIEGAGVTRTIKRRRRRLIIHFAAEMRADVVEGDDVPLDIPEPDGAQRPVLEQIPGVDDVGLDDEPFRRTVERQFGQRRDFQEPVGIAAEKPGTRPAEE